MLKNNSVLLELLIFALFLTGCANKESMNSGQLISQRTNDDNKREMLEEPISEETRHIDSLNIAAYDFLEINPRRTIELANIALNMALDIDYIQGLGYAYHRLSYASFNLKDYKRSFLFAYEGIYFMEKYDGHDILLSHLYYRAALASSMIQENNSDRLERELQFDYLNNAQNLYEKHSDTSGMAFTYFQLGEMSYPNDTAIRYYEDAIRLFMAARDYKNALNAFTNMSMIYKEMPGVIQDTTYTNNFLKDIEIDLNTAIANNNFDKIVSIYVNLGTTWMKLGNADKSKFYFDAAKQYLEGVQSHQVYFQAFTQLETYYRSFENFNDLESLYRQVLASRHIKTEHYHAYIYLSLAQLYLNVDQEQAIECYDQALVYSDSISEDTRLKLSKYECQSMVYADLLKFYQKMGDQNNSLKYALLLKEAEKKRYSESMEQEYFLSVITQLQSTIYSRQKEDLLNQKYQIKRIQNQKLFNMLAVLSILVMISIFLLVILYREGKLERKLKTLKAKSLELALASIMQFSALIHPLKDQLKELLIHTDALGKTKIRKILLDIHYYSTDSSWQNFMLQFTENHPEFIKTLLQTHPDITENEKKLCAFIRLGYKTTEIAALTGKTINSINVAKSRLKDKLNLGEMSDLQDYLSGL